MQPAVVVALTGGFYQFTPRATLKTHGLRGFKSSEKTVGLTSLKRPHSRRNPWQPECDHFSFQPIIRHKKRAWNEFPGP